MTRLDEPPAPAVNNTVRILAFLLTLSLTLHAATIYTLYQVRETARGQVSALAEALGDAGDDVIRISVPLNQPIPVVASVPIRKTITVPIDTTITLDTEFTVPLKTPLGTYNVPVPIRGDVPIKLEAPVVIDETVEIKTTITLDTTLPLELPVRDTPLAAYLEQLRQGLLDLAERL
ncbi:MAG: hypothetical protein RLZZ387_5453 [Chloroflexota bacterium]|jgi:hypothetical protein